LAPTWKELGRLAGLCYARSVKGRLRLLLIISISVLFLDQWSKFLAVKHLTPALQNHHAQLTQSSVEPKLPAEVGFITQLGYFFGGERHPCRPPDARCPTIRLIEGRWHWAYAENPGAAWSFLANASESVRLPFFLAVSVIAIVLIVWYFIRLQPAQHLLMIALSLVLGGAIGNFVDRARLTYVIDFIVWYIGSYRWPTFNVADSAISVGVGLIFLDSLLEYLRTRKEAKAGLKSVESPKGETKKP
jgi:signal peptidase II